MISSGIVKQRITTVNTEGDFKNSVTCPDSNIQPNLRPQNQPRAAEKMDTPKNINSLMASGSLAVKNVMISKANTASNAPIGSTTIPSHFRIFAGRGFSLDCLSNGMMTVGPVTINNPPITNAVAQANPAI